MSKPTRKSNTERRRALKLLASNADGCTEAIMLAHGFTVEFLVDMVRAGNAGRIGPGMAGARSKPAG
jgi:hypothetical protein